MKRLILLLLLVALALSVEPVRRQILQRGEPVAELVRPRAELIRLRVNRWVARREARSILVGLDHRARSGLPLPDPREFPRHLWMHAPGSRMGRDPWGSFYYLEIRRDSITVGSPGEDRERGTDRDLRVSVPRQ